MKFLMGPLNLTLSTYVLLKVLEYKIEGSDRSALLTQIARIAPMMTKRDGLGFNGNMIARYLKKWNGETCVIKARVK